MSAAAVGNFITFRTVIEYFFEVAVSPVQIPIKP